MSTKLRSLLAVIGPGILIAATGIGAGDLATASFTGNGTATFDGNTLEGAMATGADFSLGGPIDLDINYRNNTHFQNGRAINVQESGTLRARSRITSHFGIPSSRHLRPLLNRRILEIVPLFLRFCSIGRDRI